MAWLVFAEGCPEYGQYSEVGECADSLTGYEAEPEQLARVTARLLRLERGIVTFIEGRRVVRVDTLCPTEPRADEQNEQPAAGAPAVACNHCGRPGSPGTIGERCNACGVCRGTMQSVGDGDSESSFMSYFTKTDAELAS